MFPLNYASPKSGRAVKKEICSLDNNLSLTSVSWMHVASNGILHYNCQNYSSLLSPCPGPITTPYFMLNGGIWVPTHCGKTIAHSTSQNLSYIDKPQSRTTVSKAWFMTRSPSASSERRRVHHSDFSQASVLFHPKAGEGRKKREKKGGRQRASEQYMDGWKREELTGESEAREREKAGIHLSIHQRGDTALQIC